MVKYMRVILFGIIIVLAACTPNSTESSPTVQMSPTPQPVTPVVTSEPSVAAPQLDAGETPKAIFDSVLADLMTVAAPGDAEVTVVKSEAVIWSDGSLGCPQPDVMYTQALVEGYQVIFAVDDKLYDYHISDSGFFVLCNISISTGISEGTPTQ